MKVLDRLLDHGYINTTSIDKTDLNVFSFLCLSLLSHRTNDKVTNSLRDYFLSLVSPKCMLKKSFLEVFYTIRKVNFSHKKTKILFVVAKYINDNFSETPSDFDQLISIPYIGPKTASLVNNNFSNNNKIKFITIDTHVDRFFLRFFQKPSSNYKNKSDIIIKNVSDKNRRYIADSIIGFAKRICTRKPKCGMCLLHDECAYTKKNNI